jgi:hypothetical protein
MRGPSNHNEDMDGNGARELARLLEKRHGHCPPASVRKALLSSDAAPIYHWLGIEPGPSPFPAAPARVEDPVRRPSA